MWQGEQVFNALRNVEIPAAAMEQQSYLFLIFFAGTQGLPVLARFQVAQRSSPLKSWLGYKLCGGHGRLEGKRGAAVHDRRQMKNSFFPPLIRWKKAL